MPDAPVWVHDYHLLPAPTALRDLGVANPTAFFLHTPFPAPSLFARVPQRVELLEGLAGADVVGFQTDDDRARFTATWRVFAASEPPRLVTAPASIHVESFVQAARHPRTCAPPPRCGSASSATVSSFSAWSGSTTPRGSPSDCGHSRFSSHGGQTRRRLTYVQLATPSRSGVPEYRRLRSQVEAEIGRIRC